MKHYQMLRIMNQKALSPLTLARMFSNLPKLPEEINETKKTLQDIIDEQVEQEQSEFLPNQKHEDQQNKDGEVITQSDDQLYTRNQQNRQLRKKVKMRDDIDTYDEGEVDYYNHQDENLPLAVRERR